MLASWHWTWGVVRAGQLLTLQRGGSGSTGWAGGGEPGPGQQSSWDDRSAGDPWASEPEGLCLLGEPDPRGRHAH